MVRVDLPKEVSCAPERADFAPPAARWCDDRRTVTLTSEPLPVSALADEVKRRGESPEERYPSLYLIVYDLAQIRDLRQTEDDYSFSFSKTNGAAPAPPMHERPLDQANSAIDDLRAGKVLGRVVLKP